MEIFRTRRQYPAAPPLVLKVENKKHPARDQVGMFFVLCELHIPENSQIWKKNRQLRVKPILLQWSVELFWNRFLFLAFVQEFYSKATSIIIRQNAHVNKKCVVFFTLFRTTLLEKCCEKIDDF